MDIALLSVIIFIVIIVLFVSDRLPMATTAILGCALMVILGVSEFKTAFGQFASSTVILTIGVMIIGEAISETGLADVIGAWIVKVSSGSEVKLIIGTYFVSAAMSAFLTNSAVLAMFIPIITSLSKVNKSLKAKTLIMPIAYGCVIGGASTLVGSTQQMTTQGLLVEAGQRAFKTFDFLPVAGVILIIGALYVILIGRHRGEKIWGDREDDADALDAFSASAATTAVQPSKPKMIIVAVIFAATVVLYITEWLPLAVTSTTAALLCIITGCITQQKAILCVNWNIVGRLGGCLGIGKCLEAAGGTELMADWFRTLVGPAASPFILFCILVFLVQFSSEFMSNSTAIMIVIPILLAVAPDMGLNVYAYALGITIASGVPLSSPLASSTMGMSMVAGYRTRDYFKYSFPMDVLSYLTVIIMVPLIYGLTV